MELHMPPVVPMAIAVSVVSLFGLAAYFGDSSSTASNPNPKKRLRYVTLFSLCDELNERSKLKFSIPLLVVTFRPPITVVGSLELEPGGSAPLLYIQ